MKSRKEFQMLKFALAAMVLTLLVAQLGCDVPPDGDIGEVDPTDPMPEPEPTSEPECGLQTAEEEGDFLLPPDWTNGHPFVIGDFVGYADTVTNASSARLRIRIFNEEGGVVQEHWIASYDLAQYEEGSYAYFHIYDVVVREDLVHILWKSEMIRPDGASDPFPAYGLAVIMPELNLAGTSYLPQLMWAGNVWTEHRLAFDEGGALHLGSYDVMTAELWHRDFIVSADGYALAFLYAEFVHQLDDRWQFSILNAFSVEEGALHYRVGGGSRVHVAYRACE